MRQLAKQKLDVFVDSLLNVHDTPDRTAAAFGLGVTIGFSPFIGLHTLMGIALAFMFRLNRVAVLAGVWLNLPWIVAPYYAGATMFGGWLTGYPIPADFLGRLESTWDPPTWRLRTEAIGHLLRPLIVPYTLGSTLVSLPLGAAGYGVSRALLRNRKR
jgi:uncharacterized protein (DUF2062 family)